MKIPEILAPTYLPSLNGLRAISILIVVLAHFGGFSGVFGVTVFFVISGFLITTLLLKEKAKNGSVLLSNFYRRRALRILPVAFLYLVVLAVVALFIPLEKLTYQSFLSAILFLRNTTIIPAHDMYTAHYWSLSVEEQFYILFPVLLVWNLKVYKYLLIALIFAVPAIDFLWYHPIINIWGIKHLAEFTTHLPGIVMGSLLSIFLFQGWIKPELQIKHKSLYSTILLIIAWILNDSMITIIPSALSHTLAAFAVACLILINLKEGPNDYFFRVLNSKAFTAIGVLSYSIYIWQQFFTYNTLGVANLPESLRIGVNMLLLVIFSFLSYRFFEKRFLRLKERFAVEIKSQR